VSLAGQRWPPLNPAPAQLPGAGKILIGFSGGPDSVCLASLLLQSMPSREVLALHVDHGLDERSAERAAAAVEIAEQLGLHCRLEEVSVEPRKGPEADARKARYEVFSHYLNADDVLLTAHHADDQAETILMRLLRGSSPRGLAGIPRQRRMASGWIARPLLDWTRNDILDWLDHHQLQWVEDPTNLDTSLDRNYLRQHIMPALSKRWSGAGQAIRRSGQLCAGAAECIEQTARHDLKMLTSDAGRVSMKGWTELSGFRQASLIRHWAESQGHPAPPGPQLDEFLDQVRHAGADRQPELRWNDAVLHSYDNCLWLEQLHSCPPDWQAHWQGMETLTLPEGLGTLSLTGRQARLDFMATVCFGQAGESIRLPGRQHRHSLSQLMNEAGIPPWQRRLWPRLWKDSTLLAVGSVWIDQPFAQWLESHNWQLCWNTRLFRPDAAVKALK
jgi:tRNA(Ile)-lysidine synthase